MYADRTLESVWRPPGEEVIALASADVQDGLGVVLHYDDGAEHPNHVTLTALDLGTGTRAWSREQDREHLAYLDRAVLGGGRIATAAGWERPVLRTLDARTGETVRKHRLDDPVSNGRPPSSRSPSPYGWKGAARAAGPVCWSWTGPRPLAERSPCPSRTRSSRNAPW